MLKKKLKKAISIFQWLFTAVLVLVVLLLIFTTFNPIKSFQVLRVMSGSMEPAIKVGSVAFTQKVKPEALKKGEIITYASAEDPNMSVTHRLVEIEEKEGKTVFKTKGDANNTEDITEVSSSQIKGRVIFSLPFLGYLSVWIRKPLGFGLLVILPAILIIISEILNIKKTIEKEVEKKYAKPEKRQKNKPIGLLLIFFLLGIGLFQIKPTNAYFSDVVVIEGNTFSMGWWADETAPESHVINLIYEEGDPRVLPDYENNLNFTVYYVAKDDLSGVDQVQLYYNSYEDGDWQLFETDTDIDGKFQFTSPNGDGFYGFLTVAVDNAGNVEEDENKNGVLESNELSMLPADSLTMVDTTPPVTMISVEPYLAVVNEQLYNGGFENGNLDGWIASSSGGEHKITSEDKKTGNYSALIGFRTAEPSSEPAFDSIKQNVSLPNWITSTLSFWYRLLTETDVSWGFFEAIVNHGAEEIKVAHDGWDDVLLYPSNQTDLGWKNV
ncbi:signal peptidase I, partial [Candidatus Shapirobacteria bacterium CG10_big_fil_rev_8_21_14_0_10_40_9]